MVKANSVQRRMNKYFLDRILNQDKKLYYERLDNDLYCISDGIISFIDSNLLFNKTYITELSNGAIQRLINYINMNPSIYSDVTKTFDITIINEHEYLFIQRDEDIYYVDKKYFQLLYSKDYKIYAPAHSNRDPLVFKDQYDNIIGFIMPVRVC